jgi:protein-S-isoprenylcysteine O-methyltransferase Ste14
MLRQLSILGYIILVCSIMAMIVRRTILADVPLLLAVQGASVFLMFWARMTFGKRSFHLAANPTAGGLVTTGPYRFIRHPIYAAILYFVWASALSYGTWQESLIASFAILGAGIRMFAEEKLVAETYPDYADYARRTKRIVPFLF